MDVQEETIIFHFIIAYFLEHLSRLLSICDLKIFPIVESRTDCE